MLSCKFRPHHALCMLFFEGKGYSEEFVSYLDWVLSNLKKEDSVQITFGVDDLCHHCPNREEGLCKAEEKVTKLDEEVARLCGFQNNQYITFGEFQRIATNQIIKRNKLKQVCASCEWYSICETAANTMESSH